MHEDKQGEPFVGAAGQLLTRMLGEIGLRREDVYIANVLRCRPPGNRDPLPDEIEACTPVARRDDLDRPAAVIVTLGNFATKFVLQTPRGITLDARARSTPGTAARVIPTFHPAAILHGGGEKGRQFQDLRDDFALIRRDAGRLRDRAGVAARDARRPNPSEHRGRVESAGRAAAGAVLRWSWRLRAATAEDTRAVGEALSPLLRLHDVVVLTGELGAGKTTFVQGSRAGSARTEHVASPTFTLVREYVSGRLPIAHVDVYRLERVQDVVDLALEELEGGDGVLLVEWGDAVGGAAARRAAPGRAHRRGPGRRDDARRIACRREGPCWARAWPSDLERALAPWRATA